MDTWIVTGGAGFIGCNFVRLALEQRDVRVVVLDKLTYAGHLESLAEVESDPRYVLGGDQAAARLLQSHLFLKLHRGHRRHRLEVPMEAGNAHTRQGREVGYAQRLGIMVADERRGTPDPRGMGVDKTHLTQRLSLIHI